jgi:hypothetical protein
MLLHPFLFYLQSQYVAAGCTVRECQSDGASMITDAPTSQCNPENANGCAHQFINCASLANGISSTCRCYGTHIQCLHDIDCLPDSEMDDARVSK